jgi:hypothetical protein
MGNTEMSEFTLEDARKLQWTIHPRRPFELARAEKFTNGRMVRLARPYESDLLAEIEAFEKAEARKRPEVAAPSDAEQASKDEALAFVEDLNAAIAAAVAELASAFEKFDIRDTSTVDLQNRRSTFRSVTTKLDRLIEAGLVLLEGVK